MASTSLTLFVGLTPADSQRLFEEKDAAIEPHWKGRWGLKRTPLEVGNDAKRKAVIQCVAYQQSSAHVKLSRQFGDARNRMQRQSIRKNFGRTRLSSRRMGLLTMLPLGRSGIGFARICNVSLARVLRWPRCWSPSVRDGIAFMVPCK